MTIGELKEKIKQDELTIQRFIGKDIIIPFWSTLNSCKQVTINKTFINVVNKYIGDFYEISELIKDLYIDWPKFKLTQSTLIQTFVVLIRVTEELKLKQLNELFLLSYSIYTHYSLLRRYLKFCDDHVYTLALETLPGQHLFKQKNGMSNALSYISISIYENWKKHIINTNKSKSMIRLIYDIRSRWEQSLKAMMIRYYKIKNHEIDIVQIGYGQEKQDYAIDDRFDEIINHFINDTIIYKSINMNLVMRIEKILKMKKTYFYPLLQILTKINEDELKMLCYTVIDNESYDSFTQKDFIYKLLKKLSTKRTKDRSSIKEKIDDFILEKSKIHDRDFSILFSKLSLPYKQKIRIALVYYLYYNLS